MSTNNRMHELIEFFKTNPPPEAIYEEYYAENVVVRENQQPPRVGRALSIERQKLMNANIKEVHEFKIGAILVDGDRSMAEMSLDATTHDGYRIKLEEVGLQTWQDGKIIHERYFYDPASFDGKAKEYNQMH
ncbi:nuclear transport factor 2 family protein [Chamaesiphon minutus]|uniref:SnoaL-like polyketide cyclase n=1 Tax=Chamaesiphon minutus (strain ATCC 27169 / PCC 6605) TaxID=1173020 RepID=K9UQH2_CHAP6|nr:SnoaL-like domain-containing protein [Chamaesiphon minutus]AFY96484.1 SnoaL-like polyketide cyclase [Chamaesiphon minutus PCC 6605]